MHSITTYVHACADPLLGHSLHLTPPIHITAGTRMAEYRFVGINTPNLHRIETNSSDSTLTAIPASSEIWDLLCGVQQMGARVARTYVILFCNDGTWHVSNASALPFNTSLDAAPALSFNEEWFLALDTAVYTADQLGVRLHQHDRAQAVGWCCQSGALGRRAGDEVF